MGAVGAAYATLFTLSFLSLIRGIQNWKLLHLIPWSTKLIKPIIAGIITMLAGYYLKQFIMPFHTILTLVCAGLVIFTVFFTILWLFGFDEDDKGLKLGIYMILSNSKSSKDSR